MLLMTVLHGKDLSQPNCELECRQQAGLTAALSAPDATSSYSSPRLPSRLSSGMRSPECSVCSDRTMSNGWHAALAPFSAAVLSAYRW